MARIPLFGIDRKIRASVLVGWVGIRAALAFVLLSAYRLSLKEIDNRSSEQPASQFCALLLQFLIADSLRNIESLLSQDIAAIQPFIHQVDRHPGTLVAQTKGPEQRLRATIRREQRGMHVQRAQARESQHLGWDPLREASRANDIGLIALEEVAHRRIGQAGDLPEGHGALPGQLLHGGMQKGLIDRQEDTTSAWGLQAAQRLLIVFGGRHDYGADLDAGGGQQRAQRGMGKIALHTEKQYARPRLSFRKRCAVHYGLLACSQRLSARLYTMSTTLDSVQNTGTHRLKTRESCVWQGGRNSSCLNVEGCATLSKGAATPE